MSEEKKPIEFGRKELSPDDHSKYKDRIQKATGVGSLKGNEPLGGVQRPQMPLLQNAKRYNTDSLGNMGGQEPQQGVQPRPAGSPLLRPETQSQLQGLAQAQTEEAAKESEPEEKKSEEDLFDMFDFAGKSEAERILNNKKRRKDIESRLQSMLLSDLVMKDEVQQLVPIVPGGFEVRYRSVGQEEQLWLKKYIYKETQANDMYLMEKYNTCLLALSLVSINGAPFLDHRNSEGEVDEKLFERKLKQVLKKSSYVIADMGINYAWFDVRVRRLLNPDDLKNG